MENQNSQKEIKYLYRSQSNRVISGVCGGMGEYLGLDATLLRILFVLLAFVNGIGILLYLLALIIIPKNRSEENHAISSTKQNRNTSVLIGSILIIIGIYLLMGYFTPFWFPFDFYWNWVYNWRLFWPVLLILIGAFYIWYVSSRPPETAEGVAPKSEFQKENTMTTSETHHKNRLYRSFTNKKIAGVCGGLGDYFGIDPTWIRLGWLFISLFQPPAGIIAYIVMVIVVPYEEKNELTK